MAAKKSSRSKSAARGKSKRTAKRSSAKRSTAKRSGGRKSATKRRSSSRTKSPRARARAIVKRTKRVASTVAKQAVDLAQSAGHKISETAGAVTDRF